MKATYFAALLVLVLGVGSVVQRYPRPAQPERRRKKLGLLQRSPGSTSGTPLFRMGIQRTCWYETARLYTAHPGSSRGPLLDHNSRSKGDGEWQKNDTFNGE